MVSSRVLFPVVLDNTMISISSFGMYRTINGHSNILIYGSEVQSGCRIIGNGSSDTRAVITVDFGQGSCTSGKAVTLEGGSIFIGGDEIVTFGAPFKDVIFAMTNCDDVVTIVSTHPDSSSIEILGYDGDDSIYVGDASLALDTNVFGNVIIDGGFGDGDILMIRDQGSSVSKEISMYPTMFKGIIGSGNDTIYYFDMEDIDVLLGSADTQVIVYDTPRDVPLDVYTQGKHYVI
jgi:hypothetical protein